MSILYRVIADDGIRYHSDMVWDYGVRGDEPYEDVLAEGEEFADGVFEPDRVASWWGRGWIERVDGWVPDMSDAPEPVADVVSE